MCHGAATMVSEQPLPRSTSMSPAVTFRLESDVNATGAGGGGGGGGGMGYI